MNDSIRKEAYDIFVTNANHSSRSKIMWVKKHHPDLYIQIENNYKDNISFIEKIWLYINNMNEIPKCPICGKNTKFDGKLSRGYRTYCSIQCVNKSKSVFEKRKKSMIKNFGVEHTFQSKSLMEKSANTVQNKYHVKNVSNSE